MVRNLTATPPLVHFGSKQRALVHSSQMLGACSICIGMCGNVAQIITEQIITSDPLSVILLALAAEQGECYVVVPGAGIQPGERIVEQLDVNTKIHQNQWPSTGSESC